MRHILIALGLLAVAPASAEDICDFEHQCYHGDLAHPDRVTPPPAPQYAKPFHPLVIMPPAPDAPACRLMRIREAPTLPSRIVELCSISPAEERAIRDRMNTLNGALQ